MLKVCMFFCVIGIKTEKYNLEDIHRAGCWWRERDICDPCGSDRLWPVTKSCTWGLNQRRTAGCGSERATLAAERMMTRCSWQPASRYPESQRRGSRDCCPRNGWNQRTTGRTLAIRRRTAFQSSLQKTLTAYNPLEHYVERYDIHHSLVLTLM